MGENSGLCGILETMKEHFHMRSLDQIYIQLKEQGHWY